MTTHAAVRLGTTPLRSVVVAVATASVLLAAAGVAVATGDRLPDRSAAPAPIPLAPVVLVPALVLLVVGLRIDRARRDHRAAVLETLGATRGRVAALGRREVRGPVVVGALVAAAVAGASTGIDLSGAGLAVRPAGPAALPWLLVGLATGLLVVLGATRVECRPRRPRTGAPARSAAPRYRGALALAALAVAGLTGAMATRAALVGGPTLPWVVGGVALTVVLVPSLCGWLTRWCAETVHTRAWRAGAPVGIVAGRQIGSSLRQVARLASLNALLIVLVVPAVGWAGPESAGADRIGGSGVIGATILLVSLWLATLDEVHRSVRAAVPIGVLTARPAFVRSVAAVRVGTSVVIACAVGGAGGLLFCLPWVASDLGIDPPYAIASALCAVSVAAGATAWALVSRAGVRTARSWRPGEDGT